MRDWSMRTWMIRAAAHAQAVWSMSTNWLPAASIIRSPGTTDRGSISQTMLVLVYCLNSRCIAVCPRDLVLDKNSLGKPSLMLNCWRCSAMGQTTRTRMRQGQQAPLRWMTNGQPRYTCHRWNARIRRHRQHWGGEGWKGQTAQRSSVTICNKDKQDDSRSTIVAISSESWWA